MRRAGGAATLVSVMLAAAGCGGDDGSSPKPASGEDAFATVEEEQAENATGNSKLAAPRWEPLATRRGSGDATVDVVVDEDAIQWRARWTCETEEFALVAGGEDLAAGSCPGEGEETAVESGQVGVEVQSSGAWSLVVEQQVDEPLLEPPLPEIASGAAELISAGDFYEVENPGRGTARLYRLPDDRLALRLEGFRTSANTDLFVWLSESRRPRTTKQALAGPYVEIAPLKSTVGDQNYLLPPGFDPAAARSVVIWCEPIRVAYTAASLAP